MKFSNQIKGKIKEILGLDISFLVIGQLISQALMLFALPFINRLFSEEIVGQWALIQSMGVSLWAFAQFRSDIAIVQSENEEERNYLFFLGSFSFSIVTIFLFFVFDAFGYTEKIQINKSLLFFCLLAFGINMMAQAYANSQKAYKAVAIARLTMSLLMYGSCLALFYVFLDKSLIISYVVACIIPIFLLVKTVKFPSKTLKEWKFNTKQLIQKHKTTLSYTTVQSLFDTINGSFFIVLLSDYYPMAAIAAYFMAERLLVAPISLVSNNVSQINFKKFHELHRVGKFSQKTIIDEIRKIIPVGLLYYGLMFFAAPLFATYFFGKNADSITFFLQILALPSLLRFLLVPINPCIYVLEKQKSTFWISTSYLLRIVLAISLMENGFSIEMLMICVTMFTVVYLFALLFLMLNSSKQVGEV